MSGRALEGIVLGTVVGKRYRIERVIGSGGQGTVFEATHLRLRQPVAVKFPHVDSRGAERRERLLREARAAFSLRSEHVARVIDVDTDADLMDGALFIVMEYLSGVDLKSRIAVRGALPCDDAVGLLLQACEGIAEAHDLGIVHRDLKPSNLFLVERPSGPPLLKVLDFGMAKRVTPSLSTLYDPELTEPLRMIGSPRYMAPEQARDGRVADVRSDIWALGVILQELLTGKSVFRARSGADVLALVLTKNPTPITLLRPEVPAAIERALMRCMQKEPAYRFQNVRELARQLAPFAPPWAAANIERLLAPSRPLADAMNPDVAPPPDTSFVQATEPKSWARHGGDATSLPAPPGPAVAQPNPPRGSSGRRTRNRVTAIALGLAAVSIVWRIGIASSGRIGAPIGDAGRNATLEVPRVLAQLAAVPPRTAALMMIQQVPIAATEPAQLPDATATEAGASSTSNANEGGRPPASLPERAPNRHSAKHGHQDRARSTGSGDASRARLLSRPHAREATAPPPRSLEGAPAPAPPPVSPAKRPRARVLATSETQVPFREPIRVPIRGLVIDGAEMENPLDGRK